MKEKPGTGLAKQLDESTLSEDDELMLSPPKPVNPTATSEKKKEKKVVRIQEDSSDDDSIMSDLSDHDGKSKVYASSHKPSVPNMRTNSSHMTASTGSTSKSSKPKSIGIAMISPSKRSKADDDSSVSPLPQHPSPSGGHHHSMPKKKKTQFKKLPPIPIAPYNPVVT